MPEIDRRAFVQAGGSALLGLGLGPFRPTVRQSDRPTLVVVFLRGGLDGLSVLVPHGDPRYYRARPRTAIPAASVIRIDDYFGLHPALTPLKPYCDDARLTVIPAAGIPPSTRSHVDAQDRIDAVLARRGAVAFATLGEVARRIHAGTAPAVAVVNVGGWDSHVNQGSIDGSLASRLRRLGHEIATFAGGLGKRAREVTLVTLSEFGRTIRENGNGGTDHGRATAMLVLGDARQASGVWAGGRWPGLEGSELAVTTDVRELFS